MRRGEWQEMDGVHRKVIVQSKEKECTKRKHACVVGAWFVIFCALPVRSALSCSTRKSSSLFIATAREASNNRHVREAPT